MKSRQMIGGCLLAGASLLLTSCISSKNPVSAPETAKVDADLAGVWRTKPDSGEVEYYHVGRAGGKLPTGIMRAICIGHSKDGTLNPPSVHLLFSTKIGENRYFNVAEIDDKNLDQFGEVGWQPALVKGYSISMYRVQGDTLSVWVGNAEAQRKAIQAGKIKGTVDKDSTSFTDSSENVAALLSNPENVNLFEKEPLKYERVK